jgi:hypothetical protein
VSRVELMKGIEIVGIESLFTWMNLSSLANASCGDNKGLFTAKKDLEG